jgi:hypothetical protein
MKQRDYDPDFSYMVAHRRKAARLALAGYAFIVFVLLCCIAAVVAGLNHFLRFL